MRRKAYIAVFALMVTAFGVAASFAYRVRTTAAPLSPVAARELLGMLPASDAVAFMDAQRALSEVMPNIFVNDATTLARVNQEIDKFREHTGTDARSFDAIALGVRFNKATTTKNPDFIVGFVRGRFSAGDAIKSGMAKAKAQPRPATWTEEQYEGVTIYAIERSGGSGVAAIDANTIVFGAVTGIRAALEARSGRGARVDSSLVELATLNSAAVAGFAANVPAGFAQMFAGSDVEFGKNFASIRQIYGSVDAMPTTGALSVTLRSETTEQAEALSKQLNSLKQLASFYFSQASKQADAQLGTLVPDDNSKLRIGVRGLPFPPKWVKDVAITAEGSDVKIRLEEPLAEVAEIFRRR